MSTTISLICSNCNQTFQRLKSDHRRNLYKQKNKTIENIRIFCSKSCNATYRNNHGTYKIPINSQPGNQHARKYKSMFSYYITRVFKDTRGNICPSISKEEFANYIESIWNGKCHYSNIDIYTRNYKGKCERTDNVFQIASLDRIDNSIGYEPGNLVWTSVGLNLARNSRSYNDFINDLEFLFNLVPRRGIEPPNI